MISPACKQALPITPATFGPHCFCLRCAHSHSFFLRQRQWRRPVVNIHNISAIGFVLKTSQQQRTPPRFRTSRSAIMRLCERERERAHLHLPPTGLFGSNTFRTAPLLAMASTARALLSVVALALFLASARAQTTPSVKAVGENIALAAPLSVKVRHSPQGETGGGVKGLPPPAKAPLPLTHTHTPHTSHTHPCAVPQLSSDGAMVSVGENGDIAFQTTASSVTVNGLLQVRRQNVAKPTGFATLWPSWQAFGRGTGPGRGAKQGFHPPDQPQPNLLRLRDAQAKLHQSACAVACCCWCCCCCCCWGEELWGRGRAPGALTRNARPWLGPCCLSLSLSLSVTLLVPLCVRRRR